MVSVHAMIRAFVGLYWSIAAKFWPIYNDFEDKQMELKRDRMKSYIDRFESNEKLSEKEATILLNQMESADDELHQLRKKFISNLKNILPSVKILKLKKDYN